MDKLEPKATFRIKEERAEGVYMCSLRRPYFSCENSTLENYSCKICRFEIDALTLLKKHIKEEHVKEKFSSLSKLKNHICQNCSFQTYSRLHWFKHATNKCSERVETPEEFCKMQRWFLCQKCDYKSSRKSHIKRHFNARHTDESNKKGFKCEKCTYRTTDRSCLKKHFEARHLDDDYKKWFECEKCTYKTLQRSNLKRHFIACHTNIDNKKWFECDKCTFKTKQKYYLKGHFNAMHAEEKELFECYLCTYKATHKSNLRRHFYRKHPKVLFESRST